MKLMTLSVAVAVVSIAGCSSTPDRQVRIDCGATDVILTAEQGKTIQSVNAITETSSQEYATAVCATFEEIDASGFAEPTDATVVLTNGTELSAQLQASQQ